MTELLKHKMQEGDENSPQETLSGLKEMAMGNLERIADYANMISKRMNEGQELDSWMYSQLTIALENLNSVHDAMDGNDGTIEPPKK
jgi:phosphate uptake regulator